MSGPTTDHREIREWARACQATPVEARTRKADGEPAQLRFVFGEVAEVAIDELQPITWEQFFALFDMLGLALVYGQGQQYELLQKQEGSPRRAGEMGARHDGEGRAKVALGTPSQEGEPQEGEQNRSEDSPDE